MTTSGTLATRLSRPGISCFTQYDPATNSHIVKINDFVFGLSRTRAYDMRFGTVSDTFDVNNQQEHFQYDNLGRMTGMWAPQDFSGGTPVSDSDRRLQLHCRERTEPGRSGRPLGDDHAQGHGETTRDVGDRRVRRWARPRSADQEGCQRRGRGRPDRGRRDGLRRQEPDHRGTVPYLRAGQLRRHDLRSLPVRASREGVRLRCPRPAPLGRDAGRQGDGVGGRRSARRADDDQLRRSRRSTATSVCAR